MELNNISFTSHESCDALTSSILEMPGASRREKRKVLRNGQILWTPIDRPKQVFVLENGRIEVTETNRSGKSAVMQIVRPGEIFGYLCFCDHRLEAHGTEARATIASSVLVTDYEAFRVALNRSSTLAVRLTEALCGRVVEAERRIRVLAIHDAKKRLATLLHQLASAKQTATSAHHGFGSIHLSHAEIAALASLTRPHTTVIMTRFRKLGCIAYDRGTAIKVNLEHIASFID